MSSVSGPTIVRRQLGRRLRQVRVAAGKSIEDVAEAGIISRATMFRYESGTVPVSPGTMLALGMLYGLDPTTAHSLYALAIGTKAKGWWEDSTLAPASGFGLYLGLEAAAAVIQCYEPDIVLGLLQTPEYAQAVEYADESKPTENVVQEIVTIRMKRQQTLFARTPPPQIKAVLGSSAMTREVGGQEVMTAQIEHLRHLAAVGTVDLRILPLPAGAHAAMAGGFTHMMYGHAEDPAVVYVQTAVGGSYFELPAQVARYSRVFDSIWAQATTIEEYTP